MFDPWLKEGWEIAEDPSSLHLATILTSSGAPIEQRYIFYFRHMLFSIFNHSRDVAITLVIITDSLRPIKVPYFCNSKLFKVLFFIDVERCGW